MATDQTGTPLASGTSIGSYVIRQSLGADEQGLLYLADHPVHRSVLLHELFAHEFAHREEQNMVATDAGDRVALRWWVRSYLDRAHSVGALRHPKLLPLLESAEHHGSAFYACTAPTMPQLQVQLDRGTALPASSVENLLIDLMDAVEALHAAGIVHRAIGPRLIWASDSGRARLGGFGSLRAAIRFRTRSLHSVAPAFYAAPEEWQAEAQITAAADIYAIAAVVHHAASGHRPPAADQRLAGVQTSSLAEAVNQGLPATLAGGIERALALDPARRPQTIAQWRETMNFKAAPAVDATVTAPPTTATAAPSRFSWALVAVPVVLIAGIAGFMLLRPESKPPAAPAQALAVEPLARAPTDTDRPRFVPASLGTGSSAPSLNQAAINAISAETREAPEAEDPSPREEPARASIASRSEPSPAAAAAAAIVDIPQPTPRPLVAAEAPARLPANNPDPVIRSASDEVAVLTPPTAAAITPAEAAVAQSGSAQVDHAQQLALERSRCDRHVSELFADRDFTYADIARFEDVVKLDNGRLQTPKLKTDDGRRVSFLIDEQGCIVRMMR
ncbi:MAG: hypothetical protein M3O62_06540 [Pseudomonadota bacterium]|nr:hypothetical protein [Pseudomonadota bacterium]